MQQLDAVAINQRNSAAAVWQRPLAARQLRRLPAALRTWHPRLTKPYASTACNANRSSLVCPAASCTSRLPGWRPPVGLQQGRQPRCCSIMQQQAQP